MDLNKEKIWVTGHNGMLGSALLIFLKKRNFKVLVASREQLDLTNEKAVLRWVNKNEPSVVINCAAKTGGIGIVQKEPVEFLTDNIRIQINILKACNEAKIKKILNISSNCIYPKDVSQPMREYSILSGGLDPTNEPFSLSKIIGLKLSQYYFDQYQLNCINAIPCNLYGPNDNFDLNRSHVIPALIKKFDDAKTNNLQSVHLWGSGKPLREYLYVDDCAEALIKVIECYTSKEPVNIGSKEVISIKELSSVVSNIVGYDGQVIFDRSYPDGHKIKQLDTSKIDLINWKPKIKLIDGLKLTYDWYRNLQK